MMETLFGFVVIGWKTRMTAVPSARDSSDTFALTMTMALGVQRLSILGFFG